jgi:hypothetical protein
MIGTLDTETAGLFGDMRLIGWYDEEGGYQVSTKASDWYDYAQGKEIAWYAHNLDFDLAKLWRAIPSLRDSIMWSKSIFINFRATKVVFANGVELHDSMSLLPGSLDKVLSSWGTDTQKIDLKSRVVELGYKDIDDYFCRVNVNDEEYREYTKHDVTGLYEVIKTLLTFTGLKESDFCKRITTASLAVRLFKEWCPEEYKALTKTRWRKESDVSLRRAYYGGRTEVFRTSVENGYHYDVNSLYPYVMGEYEYPYGYPEESTDEGKALGMWQRYLPDSLGQRWYKACIVTAEVDIPLMDIPPLPVRAGGRLVFPCGIVTGTWCGAELELALSYGCKIRRIIDCTAWTQTLPYFGSWIERMSEKKINAQGAEREFYKLLQNALYGKFGQRRDQVQVSEWSRELEDKLKREDKGYCVRETDVGMLCDHEVTRYAEHMQPHVAAHITAYARMHWYKAVRNEVDDGNHIIYGDTDSLVVSRPMREDVVGPLMYGYWKLERKVVVGLYLSPKLYGEVDVQGNEHLKGKGLVKSYRATMTMATYADIAKRLACGESIIELYSGIENRRRWLRCILTNTDTEKPRQESKRIHSKTWQKRKINWLKGTTQPWLMQDLTRFLDSGRRPRKGVS